MEIGEKDCEVGADFKFRLTKCDLLRARVNGGTGSAICIFWVDKINFFANAPVAHRARTSNKWELSRSSSEKLQTRKIIGPVVRLHRKGLLLDARLTFDA